MFKTCLLLIVLAIAGARSQDIAAVGESAPEPYSYGYETDSHSASESKDPNGRVTGFYNLLDADGRQRRVEYYADETGFHAKVQTNEVGTKTGTSADVEVLASPPNREQFVLQAPVAQPAPVVQQQPQLERFVSRQVTTNAQPARTLSYVQQPYGYGAVNNLYGYASNPGYAVTGNQYGYGFAGNNPYGYGVVNTQSRYTNYNNHLPSQYYKSIQTVQPASYGVTNTRYSSTQLGPAPVVGPVSTGGYRVGVPQTVTYQSSGVPASVGYSTRGSTSNLSGSSNYILLKKRETAPRENQRKD